MQFKECVFSRRSIRKFSEEDIDDSVIKEIVEAGIFAPSACNFQAWKFIVIKDKNILNKFDNDISKQAPVCIAVAYRNDFFVSGHKHKDYIQSASAAIQNMLLMSHSIGLGACWLCHLPKQKTMRKILNVPKNFDVISLVALGKPQINCENSEEQKIVHYGTIENFLNHKRKYGIEEVICYDNFYATVNDVTHKRSIKKKLLPQIIGNLNRLLKRIIKLLKGGKKKCLNMFFNLFKEAYLKRLDNFISNIKSIDLSKEEITEFKNSINTHSDYKRVMSKLTPQKKLSYFCIHLVGECNLNCRGCDHFAPLAKGEYLDLESFEKDFQKLSLLTNQKIDRIGLMGGEALLHPQLIEFFPIARKYFKNTKLQLVTNGILLNEQKEEFWRSCAKNKIEIVCTKYPLNLKYEQMKKTANKFKVKFSYYDMKNDEKKKSYKCPVDVTGCQNPLESFTNCFHSNRLCFLTDGKIYTCTISPNAYRFNNAFDKNMYLSENDYIDIHKINKKEELLNFLSQPINFCKNCDVKNRVFGLEWKTSKKNITEWTNN